MGGCCSGSSRGEHPRATEERVPLASHPRTLSTISSGVLVDTNLDTSDPDTYRPPPPPIPFEKYSQTPQRAQEISTFKRDGPFETTDSDSSQVTVGNNALVVSALTGIKESEDKAITDVDLDSAEETKPEISKEIEDMFSLTEEEDGCPICLEDYDDENPKLRTRCDHHFHLACILEWMERSETCPVCGKEVAFDTPVDY